MKKQLTILFLLVVLFPFKSISFAQQRDSLIQIYPTLGDTIYRVEKEFYGLFTSFPGFEQATYYIRDNKYLVSRITYINAKGVEKDTTLVQPLNLLGNIRAHIHTVYESRKDAVNSGKLVIITTVDEKTLTAKLVTIDNNTMILYAPALNPSESEYETNIDLITLPKNQIKSVFIPGESNIGTSALWGGVAGVIFGAALGYLSGDDPPGTFFRMTAGQKASYLGIGLGLFGAATGLIVGLISSTDDQLIEIKSDADYNKLKYEFKNLYRVNNYHNKYSYQ